MIGNINVSIASFRHFTSSINKHPGWPTLTKLGFGLNHNLAQF